MIKSFFRHLVYMHAWLWRPTYNFFFKYIYNKKKSHYYQLFELLEKSVTVLEKQIHTVKPRPEAHMGMILFEVFLKSIDLNPQQQILQRHYYR